MEEMSEALGAADIGVVHAAASSGPAAWLGEPFGAEGQPIAWVDPQSLGDFQVPEANAEIMARVAELPRWPTYQSWRWRERRRWDGRRRGTLACGGDERG